MKYQVNDKFSEVLKIVNINKQKNLFNISALTHNGQEYNMNYRGNEEGFYLNQIYLFKGEVKQKENKDKLFFEIETIIPLPQAYSLVQIYEIYAQFKKVNSHIDIFTIKAHIEKVITNLKNKTLKAVVNEIYQNDNIRFYLAPAGKVTHHSYLGGLAHHTDSMLLLAEQLIKVYPFLKADLLFSAIILHDFAKVDEISGVNGEYTIEGSLLGHLSMGQSLIDKAAFKLGLGKSEELQCLKHLVITHHGLPEFGSFKRPQLPEGVVLWLIDNIDARLGAIQCELAYTESGEFSNKINAIEKTKIYKTKFK